MNGRAPNNLYYSFDLGLVHYIALSTEIPFGGSDPEQNGGINSTIKAQYDWLVEDLRKANANRKAVPWIVAHGHRSIYCSCDDDCDAPAVDPIRDGWGGKYGWEELFFDQGVDLWLNGHEHNYERSWPVYHHLSDDSNVDPKATIYIVSGAAGCHELHEPFARPQPNYTAFRSNTFGYSRMWLHNATHLRWQQVGGNLMLLFESIQS